MLLGMLRESPREWWTEEQWKKIEQELSDTQAKVSTKKRPEKVSVSELITGAQHQKDTYEEHLAILRDEPAVLVHHVNACLLSRSELVMDDKGRRLPLQTDKQISGAIFEAVRSAVQKLTIWSYIRDLLELLDNADTHTVYKRVLLQEISNICHLEYSRAQAYLIRHVQTGIGTGYFRRVVNVYDETGNSKVSMKIKPEELTEDDAHLRYVLRLCHSQTSASQAVEWIDKLDELYESCPSKREELQEREMDALADLIVIVAFIQELSIVISIPSLSRKTGQAFLAGCRELHSGFNDVRKEIDLQDFSVPINKLLEPGIANTALAELDHFVVRKLGAKMEFYYQYIAQECLAYHQIHLQKTRETPEEAEQGVFPVTIAYSIADKLERREHKENTSPPRKSTSEIIPVPKAPEEKSLRQIYASPAAKKVFTTLFKKAEPGVSIPWAAFESTMVAMGFSVMHGYCSFHTFFPPSNMAVKTTFTVWQPRNSKIEGHLIPTFARRLKNAYGGFVVFAGAK